MTLNKVGDLFEERLKEKDAACLGMLFGKVGKDVARDATESFSPDSYIWGILCINHGYIGISNNVIFQNHSSFRVQYMTFCFVFSSTSGC